MSKMAENRRKDPTLQLPEEPMSYEIKRKKKKKKDPLADDDFVPSVEITFEPAKSVKVENIEVKVEIQQLLDNEIIMDGDNKERKFSTESVEETTPILLSSHVCDICNSVFSSNQTLRSHKNRKHNISDEGLKFRCSSCPRAFSVKASLKMHFKRMHCGKKKPKDTELRVCEICSATLLGKDRLKQHKIRQHGIQYVDCKHKCPYCDMAYENYKSLLAHIRRKHLEKEDRPAQVINCPFCTKIFNVRTSLMVHVKRNHSQNEVRESNELADYVKENGDAICPFCKISFVSVRYLKTHMQRNHDSYKEEFNYKCKICALTYDNIASLKTHIRRKHDKRCYCKICDKRFDNYELYTQHFEMSDPVCKECGLVCTNHTNLAEHKDSEHANEMKVFCHECGDKFKNMNRLKLHIIQVHEKKTFRCDKCDKVMNTNDGLRNHIKKKHFGELCMKERSCPYCDEKFNNEVLLCNHIDSAHMVMEGSLFCCKLCVAKFDSKQQLTAHCDEAHLRKRRIVRNNKIKKEIVDNDEKAKCDICDTVVFARNMSKHMSTHISLKCSHCDYETTTRVDFTKHMLRHKDAIPLKCTADKCSYSTFNPLVFKRHVKNHESKNLHCSTCEFKTFNKYILRSHEKEHVIGKLLYRCEECDYSTPILGNLKQHKLKHSSEKKFKCNICTFSTKYNSSLRFHIKSKHGDL